MPRIIRLSDAAIDTTLEEASRRLAAGEVVAFPTETVYGLGADTMNVPALKRVYALKGRPSDNPLIAHVADASIAETLVTHWDDRCVRLAERFWPGPLTLVLDKAEVVPDQATAGRKTVAVRCPNHPIARRLLQAFGGAISAPSANRSGHVSPTCARHVADDFHDVEDLLILDGGPCEVGLESTVLDVTGRDSVVLRPGSVTAGQLQEVLGDVRTPRIAMQMDSPGTAESHYAPRARAELVARPDLASRLSGCEGVAAVLRLEGTKVQAPHHAIDMSGSPASYAKRLYSALREADALEVDVILIEQPDDREEGLWDAIMDRLRRATSRGA